MLGAEVVVDGIPVTDERTLEQILDDLDVGEPFGHMSCHRKGVCLEVECAVSGAAFIGWIDEVEEDIFYFDNGGGGMEPVDLLINVCPEERMMCYDSACTREIVLHFCATGERSACCRWIADEL